MKTKDLSLIALFGLLTYLASYLIIPLGPVPLSLQTMMVILTALVLSPSQAVLAMVIHLALKLFLTGFQSIISPSFGFVLGFILAAFLGSLYLALRPRTFKNIVLAIIIAGFSPYVLGLPYMAFVLNILQGQAFGFFDIMRLGFLIFVPGDLVKAVLAYWIYKRIYPFVKNLGS